MNLAEIVKPRSILHSAAIMYALQGWKIFPAYGVRNQSGKRICTCAKGAACDKRPGKHPIPVDGFHAATNDPDLIRSWWDEHPDANIAMPLRANNLLAFDFDPRAGAGRSAAELVAKFGPFPETMKQLTGGGGWHLIFQDAADINFRGKLAPGIDVKSDGYIVVAPSSHLSGKSYQWDEAVMPDRDRILPLPPVWQTLACKVATPASSPLQQRAPWKNSFALPFKVHDGEGREETILQYAGQLRAKGHTQAEIDKACLAFNATRIDPPLPEDKVLDRTHRYEKDDGNLEPWLARLNADYAWIEQNASIYRLRYGDFIEPAKFKIQHDNHDTSVHEGKRMKPVGIGSAWLKHPRRAQYRELVLRPGEASITTDGCLNEWRGFEAESIKGDVTPWLDLLRRLVPDTLEQQYVLSWLAHLIQHPGEKIYAGIVMWSHEQGVGKSLLFEAVMKLIGKTHAGLIAQRDLTDDFTGWMPKRVFVIGDEVMAGDKRQNADRLKGWITGTTITVNQKYQPAREIPNHLNFVFLSNHADAVFVEDHDRRFFVWEVKSGRLPAEAAKSFVQWRDGGGVEALREYLESYDCSRFDSKAPAPMTAAKREMVEDNRSDLERWLADLIASNVNKVLGKEVVTASELARRYHHELGRRGAPPSTKAVTGACKRLGAYVRPNQVRLNSGGKVRALALSRGDYWKSQPEKSWAAELEKSLNWESLPHISLG